jgi:Acyl-CoA synthetases (AMP-forming)/AMP-acid ligases II
MPRTVLEVVARSGATLLPTTPTFLNLIIASGAHRGLDLSSVRLVTYGTEVMPEYTLNRLGAIFPAAKFKQTYGLSETGVLRSSSKTDDSLWMRIGGDGFETKVVDDMLWIRAASNMVGYLNAPSPFDADGWLCTGDRVEVEGQFLRVLGRESDLINVGGQKVFPAEVEDVLLLAENVVEAAVFGVKHELMGNVVCANVALEKPEPSAELVRRLRVHCIQHLARYKVPIRFSIIPVEDLRGERFKKRRRAEP